MNILFVRHGEGYHNITKNKENQYHIFYPSLTNKGIIECKKRKLQFKDKIYDLVIVSPLKRTLQTFNLMFKNNYKKVICIDLFREIIENNCDFRKHINQIKKSNDFIDFIDFNLNETKFNVLESEKDIQNRLQNIMNYLKKFVQSVIKM